MVSISLVTFGFVPSSLQKTMNLQQTLKPSRRLYLPAKEALVPKMCSFCFQEMEIKQINLTEAVRQCYKCSTPLQDLSDNDIEFFHRSYTDIHKNPADWKVNVRSEEEELGHLQSWMEQLNLCLSKYEDNSDDDESIQSVRNSSNSAPNDFVSQPDDAGLDDIVRELQQSVDCPNTVAPCEWNNAAIDELEAALERVSSEKLDQSVLPFSFDDFFNNELAPQKNVPQSDYSRQEYDALDTILGNNLTAESCSPALDVLSEVVVPLEQHEHVPVEFGLSVSATKEVVRQVDSTEIVSVSEERKVDSTEIVSVSEERKVDSTEIVSVSEERKVDSCSSEKGSCINEAKEGEVGINEDALILSKKLEDDIAGKEDVVLSATEKEDLSLNKEFSVLKEVPKEVSGEHPNSEIEPDVVSPNKSIMPERNVLAEWRNVNVFSTQIDSPAQFHTSMPQMNTTCINGSDDAVQPSLSVVSFPKSNGLMVDYSKSRKDTSFQESVVNCSMPIRSDEAPSNVLDTPGVDQRAAFLVDSGLNGIISAPEMTSMSSEHKSSEQGVNKFVCDCDDECLQLSPPTDAGNYENTIQLKLPDLSISSLKITVDENIDLEKVIFSPINRKRPLSRNKLLRKLEIGALNSSRQIEESELSLNAACVTDLSNSILVTVPADNDITPDMFESMSLDDIPIVFACLDGAFIPECNEKLQDGVLPNKMFSPAPANGGKVIKISDASVTKQLNIPASVSENGDGLSADVNSSKITFSEPVQSINAVQFNLVQAGFAGDSVTVQPSNSDSEIVKLSSISDSELVQPSSTHVSDLLVQPCWESSVKPNNARAQQFEAVQSNEQGIVAHFVITQTKNAAVPFATDVKFKEEDNISYSCPTQFDNNTQVKSHDLSFDPLDVSRLNVVNIDPKGSHCMLDSFVQPDYENLTISSSSRNGSTYSEDTTSTFSLLVDKPLRSHGPLVEEDEDELKSFTGAKFTPLSRRTGVPKENNPDQSHSEPLIESPIQRRHVHLLQAIQSEIKNASELKHKRKSRKKKSK